MAPHPGNFIWYDVRARDVKAAEAFYTEVIGWSAMPFDQKDKTYTVFSAGAIGIGGLMLLPKEAEEKGARSSWTGYICVDDVDLCVTKVKELGGAIYRPAEDIPNVGRFAVVADPQGAIFILFKPNGDQEPTKVEPGTEGQIGWHELHAGDREAAFGFYAELFSWMKVYAMDMGPIGVYQIFSTGGMPCGGMINKIVEASRPFWLYYFNVNDIDAAVERLKKAGGKVLNGPEEVPTGQWVAQCFDPEGAIFGMLGNRN